MIKTVKVYSFLAFENVENMNEGLVSVSNIITDMSELSEYKQEYPLHIVEHASFEDLEDFAAASGVVLDDTDVYYELTDGIYKWDETVVVCEEAGDYGDYVKVS